MAAIQRGGIIGLDAMGSRMVRNIQPAGYRRILYGPTSAHAES